MEALLGCNLVSGHWGPSRGAGTFEVRAVADPGRSTGTWPRSDAHDVEQVLAAPARFTADTGSLEARRACLVSARGRLTRDLDGAGRLAQQVGLEAGEGDALLFSERETHPERPRGAPRDPRGAAFEDVALHVLDWCERPRRVLEDVGAELLSGRRVLLCPDERAPELGDMVARALLAAGLASGALSVLHGVQPDALSCALDDSLVTCVRATGDKRSLRRLRTGRAPAGRRELLRLKRSESLALRPRTVGLVEARQLVHQAFGRVSTLTGQRAGQLGCLHVPSADYARVTEAVLEVVEVDDDVRRPVPQVDRAAGERLAELVHLGLTEGATLVHGGADLGAVRRDRRLTPIVFVNVEPDMELARRPEPVPILRLLRA